MVFKGAAVSSVEPGARFQPPPTQQWSACNRPTGNVRRVSVTELARRNLIARIDASNMVTGEMYQRVDISGTCTSEMYQRVEHKWGTYISEIYQRVDIRWDLHE